MSKIEQLIKEHCPDGVQWKALGEIGEFSNTGVDKKIIEGQKEVTLLNFVDIMKNQYINKEIPKMKVTASDQKIKKCNVLKGDIFITPSSETRDEIGFASVVLEDIPEACYSYHIMRYRLFENKMSTSFFIRYLFESIDLRNQIYKNATGLTRFGLSKDKWSNLKIPIPPIPVQQEIVRILDAFVKSQTELETNLQTELELRKKQYRYYRDMLLNFEDDGGGGRSDVEYKMLGEIGVFYGGLNGKSKSDFTDGNAKFITYMNIYNHLATNIHTQDKVKINPNEKQKSIKLGDVLFTGSSENIQECGMSSVVCEKPNETIYLNSFCFGYRLNDPSIFIPDFLKHLFRSSTLRDQIKRTASGVTRFNVSKKKMAEVLIPIPPLEEQKRIVGILDKFDRLLSDISVGIPAEIAMRRKQYEYYRDRLLEF